jgi:heparanase
MNVLRLSAVVAVVMLALGNMACGQTDHDSGKVSVDPNTLARLGAVDERYQSYNVEMLEVTGGDFWKPYGAAAAATAPSQANSVPAGMDPDAYQYRPPIDLTNARLRMLAAALGPAYVRVSGTWANTTYFTETDPPPARPPAGFNGVLTAQQWHGVVDFSKAVNAEIVSSFAISPGTRDPNGLWTPTVAWRWLDYTRSIGGDIAAAEFMNEPSLAAMGGAPAGYDAAAYGRDFKVFKAFADQAAPGMVILGPGSVGETPGPWRMTYGTASVIRTSDMLAAAGPGVTAFSYHHYGAASQRCAGIGMPQIAAKDALSEDWLRRTSQTRAYYGGLRDHYEPGKPLWVTEVADAACGGNPWAATFLDSFRYLDQLGRLAREGVRVVTHNTLAASDYGLLNETDYTPKPNYWAALLWHRLMGSTVLDPGVPIQQGLHLYAHCQAGTPGGVSLLAINNDPAGTRTLTLPTPAQRYTLDADGLDQTTVRLNGRPLALGAGDALPNLSGSPIGAGDLTLGPATITFLTIPTAANPACQ